MIDREGYRGVVRYLGPVATSKSAETIYAGEQLSMLCVALNARVVCVSVKD